jgi:hypothetical protein
LAAGSLSVASTAEHARACDKDSAHDKRHRRGPLPWSPPHRLPGVLLENPDFPKPPPTDPPAPAKPQRQPPPTPPPPAVVCVNSDQPRDCCREPARGAPASNLGLVERVQTMGIWVSERAGCYRRSRPPEPICDGKHTSIDTRAGPVSGVPEPPRREPAADRHRSRLPLAAVAAPALGPRRAALVNTSERSPLAALVTTDRLAGGIAAAHAHARRLARARLQHRSRRSRSSAPCCWSARLDRPPWPDSSPGSTRR